jgi:hypothetical protein
MDEGGRGRNKKKKARELVQRIELGLGLAELGYVAFHCKRESERW